MMNSGCLTRGGGGGGGGFQRHTFFSVNFLDTGYGNDPCTHDRPKWRICPEETKAAYNQMEPNGGLGGYVV